MYSKFKKMAALLIAAAMSLSVLGAMTVMGDDNVTFTFYSSEGEADSSIYSTGAKVYPLFYVESSVHPSKPTKDFGDGKRAVISMSLNGSVSYLNGMTNADEEVTPLDENRYIVLPLVTVGKTPSETNSVYFSDKIPSFDESTLSIDIIKGATELITKHKFESIKMGLAHIDYSQSYKYTRKYDNKEYSCYPAGIKWIDITDDFPDVYDTRYGAAKIYGNIVTTPSYPVNYIIANGEERYINGATKAQTEVTAANANAVVIDILLNEDNKDYFIGGDSMLINNIKVEPKAGTVTPTPEPTPTPVPTPEPIKPEGLLLWSRTGVSTSTNYNANTYAPNNIFVYNTWNPMSTATGTNSGKIWSCQDVFTYISLGKSVLANASAMDDAITPSSADRYRLFPLATAGGNDGLKTKSFSDYYSTDDLADSYLKVDMIKGGGFPSIAQEGENHYKAFKLGLAYVDYTKSSNYTSGNVRTAYATDMAWIDITEEVEALKEFPSAHASLDWDEHKTEIALPISDIIEKGAHTYIHGATSEKPITIANANAVVFGIELENNVYPSGNMLYFDNLRFEKAAEVSFTFSGSVANGVTLSAHNESSKPITPAVVFAYYKDGALVDVKIDKSFKVAKTAEGEHTYQLSSAEAFDHVAVMAFDSLENLVPLCTKFYE